MKKYNVLFNFRHKGQNLQFDLEEIMNGAIDESIQDEYELISITINND